MKTNRRNFIVKSLLLSTGLPVVLQSSGVAAKPDDSPILFPRDGDESFKISVFSKHLQWLTFSEMGQVAAEIGFDGIDITVRPGGHVLPERVSEDLPKAVEAVRKSGLEVFMITTAITRADDPFTESILKTASTLGIRHYRTGWYHYNDAKTIEENLETFQRELEALAALNKKYAIYGEYQNHSGDYFGAAIWDLYTVLKRIDSPWIGSQYDILHATVEGANTWHTGLKLLKPYIKSIDIKDFQWTKKNNKWEAEILPLGEGMVNFKEYLGLLKQYGLRVPVSLHYEFPMGGAEHGNKTLTIPSAVCTALMKKDLVKLREMIKQAGL